MDQDEVIREKKYWKRKKSQPAGVAGLPPSMVLQRLYLSCREMFKGGTGSGSGGGLHGSVPNSPADVQKLSEILDCMRPEDVGLSPDLQFFNPNNNKIAAGDGGANSPGVVQSTIYKNNNFSICVFFLPANAVIPLHNHPDMTVFTKLLVGTMHIKSYDWVHEITHNQNSSAPSTKTLGGRLAKVMEDNVFTAPCDSSVLYPKSGGNIHEFRAITPCAVLDVLGPPYSNMDGRDCSYYTDIMTCCCMMEEKDDDGELKKYGWLKEIDPPEDSGMDVIEYLGPQILIDHEDNMPKLRKKRRKRRTSSCYIN